MPTSPPPAAQNTTAPVPAPASSPENLSERLTAEAHQGADPDHNAGVITALNRSVAYKNQFVRLNVDDVRFPNGSRGTYATLTSASGFGGVIVARHVRRGVAYYALVEQYRYAAQTVTWEFPRGSTDDLSSVEALRELVEETGATVDACRWLGEISPDTSVLTTRVGVWLATVPARPQDHREDDIGLVSRWVTGGQLQGLIRNGQIRCGMTLAAYTLLVASGLHHVTA